MTGKREREMNENNPQQPYQPHDPQQNDPYRPSPRTEQFWGQAARPQNGPQRYEPPQPTQYGQHPYPEPRYTADTDQPVLQKRAYSSPLSFTGSTSRIIRAISRTEPQWLSITLLITAWTILLPVVWALLLAWYTMIFGLFGVFVIPWRLHRRSQRKAQHLAEAQLAAFQRFSSGGRA